MPTSDFESGRRDRATRACVILLAPIGVWAAATIGLTTQPHDPESVGPRHTELLCTIDPNTASWSQLTVLPRVGEVTARKIVAFREAAAARSDIGDRCVFAQPSDLERVPGIGPKTVQRIAPYLAFPAHDTPAPAARRRS